MDGGWSPDSFTKMFVGCNFDAGLKWYVDLVVRESTGKDKLVYLYPGTFNYKVIKLFF